MCPAAMPALRAVTLKGDCPKTGIAGSGDDIVLHYVKAQCTSM